MSNPLFPSLSTIDHSRNGSNGSLLLKQSVHDKKTSSSFKLIPKCADSTSLTSIKTETLKAISPIKQSRLRRMNGKILGRASPNKNLKQPTPKKMATGIIRLSIVKNKLKKEN